MASWACPRLSRVYLYQDGHEARITPSTFFTETHVELYVVGVGSRCVIANDRLQVWDGEAWGKLDFARFYRSRSIAQVALERIEASLRRSTMTTCVHRVGAEEFPRFVIVNKDHDVWNGHSFGDIRSGLLYAHRNLAETDAAEIEADRFDFFQDE